MLRFLLLVSCLVLVAGDSISSTSSLGTNTLNWCSGSISMRSHSSVTVYQDVTTRVHFRLCVQQSRGLSSVATGKLVVGGLQQSFPVCTSRMQCLQQSLTKRESDGLYCIDGTHEIDLPFFSSPSGTRSFRVLDASGSELASFC